MDLITNHSPILHPLTQIRPAERTYIILTCLGLQMSSLRSVLSACRETVCVSKVSTVKVAAKFSEEAEAPATLVV